MVGGAEGLGVDLFEVREGGALGQVVKKTIVMVEVVVVIIVVAVVGREESMRRKAWCD